MKPGDLDWLAEPARDLTEKDKIAIRSAARTQFFSELEEMAERAENLGMEATARILGRNIKSGRREARRIEMGELAAEIDRLNKEE